VELDAGKLSSVARFGDRLDLHFKLICVDFFMDRTTIRERTLGSKCNNFITMMDKLDASVNCQIFIRKPCVQY